MVGNHKPKSNIYSDFKEFPVKKKQKQWKIHMIIINVTEVIQKYHKISGQDILLK
jgi:hypothetical protein